MLLTAPNLVEMGAKNVWGNKQLFFFSSYEGALGLETQFTDWTLGNFEALKSVDRCFWAT